MRIKLVLVGLFGIAALLVLAAPPSATSEETPGCCVCKNGSCAEGVARMKDCITKCGRIEPEAYKSGGTCWGECNKARIRAKQSVTKKGGAQ